MDPAEEGELADAEAAGDLDLRVGVRAEGHQAVDLGRLDAGVRRARSTASAASRSSLRPDSLENSVAPMPTMAVLPVKAWRSRSSGRTVGLESEVGPWPGGQQMAHGPGYVVPQSVGAAQRHLDGTPAVARPPSSSGR